MRKIQKFVCDPWRLKWWTSKCRETSRDERSSQEIWTELFSILLSHTNLTGVIFLLLPCFTLSNLKISNVLIPAPGKIDVESEAK